MLLSKDKRILVYLLLLILFGSINNKHLTNISLFKIKNTKLVGLNDMEKANLLVEFRELKNKNIFFLQKDELIEILNSNDLIETFLINKKYPSDINIIIQKTTFLANIEILDENFLIGSNKRLIKSELSNPNLPKVLGNPSLKDFFLINDNILQSSIKLSDIKKLYFFPSKRWDLELNNGILIKLPMNDPLYSLNQYFQIKKLPQFNDVKIFDMRVENQIIVNES